MKKIDPVLAISSFTALSTGILSQIAIAPPELLNQVPMIFPEEHRGTISLILKLIMGIASWVAVSKAASTGPTK